ncbi:MAG TPA: methyltransferase domain-containing protein [Thermoanaerobaculia bacterium]|nr:methyltransferase domain-containing protein [Thermoanaerobaculia bacterium]
MFGDRERFGRRAWDDDADWKAWHEVYLEAYRDTQRTTAIQTRINESGYQVLEGIDVSDQRVAELGPGGGFHLRRLRGRPASYVALDAFSDFFPNLEAKCRELAIPVQCLTVGAYEPVIALPDASQDVFLSFYSIEHLFPLEGWLDEMFRVLRPGGILAGAIPTEGGVAWGIGRWLTSRRILKKRYGLDIRKIVCWEHPNMCDEIMAALRARGTVRATTWPVPHSPYDASLIIKFIVQKQ